MRSDAVKISVMSQILAVLTEENRLACTVSLCTGLRISDVLSLRTKELKSEFVITEQKTKKRRKIKLDSNLLDELLSISGKIFVFEGRLDARRHRTRQAVFKDLKRAAKALRLSTKLNISPHSCRKIYAVDEFHRTCDIRQIKKLLNHDNEAVTMLYAFADEMTARKVSISAKALKAVK